MEYIGEHSLPGQLGNLFISLAFATACLSVFAYFLSTRNLSNAARWKKIGRYSFITHAVSVFTITGILFYLLINHYYEYDYVAEQSKNDMSFRYILVCFWGGQKGSFTLWMICQAILGLIIIFTSGKRESQVMMFFSSIQIFLVSMILGINYWDESMLGVNPFALKREIFPDWGALWSKIPEYIQLDPSFQDGKGLNPLLQNYWMIIHPPTLFMGFALVSVPFCFALGGLYEKDYAGWIKPALPWTFVGIAVLGIGILMGGAWAYESLSFGGFWAWDPVENASFVPWLILVGAGHLMLLNLKRESSLFTTFLLTIFAFFFVLYSTFLTRSGVLGEESVHSFTGDGMMGQLLLFMFFFLCLGFGFLLIDKKLKLCFTGAALLFLILYLVLDPGTVLVKSGSFVLSVKSLMMIFGFMISFIFLYAGYQLHFPKQKKEEELWSREFWMFIGSLILLVSALQIIVTTSLPVINLLFDTNITKVSIEERNTFYNSWQLPFAVLVALLSGIAQYLKYKKTDVKMMGKKLIYPSVFSLVFTLILVWIYQFMNSRNDILLGILLFAAFFAIFSNTDFWIRTLKGKLNYAGSSVAHIGFGIILIGTVLSMGKQENLSENKQGFLLQGINRDLDNNLDVQVFRGDTVRMKNYFVTYSGNRAESHFIFYKTTYFTVKNANYKKGQRIRFGNELFECVNDHTASLIFYRDKKQWKKIENCSSEEFLKAKTWDYLACGDKIFDVEPFVQVHKDKNNPQSQMQTVSEPGTKHFLHYDIFTHLKDANLQESGDFKYVRKFSVDTLIGDTIATAGFLFTTSNIKPLIDTVRFKNKTAVSIDFSFYDIRDFEMQFPITKTLLYAFDSLGKPDIFPIEIPEMNLRVTLEKLTAESSHQHKEGEVHSDTEEHVPNQLRYKLNLETRDYIVLQVRKFPMINLLWLGCIIMFLGTFMAALYRYRANKLAKNEKEI